MVITFDCRLVCSTSKSIAKFHRFGKFSAHYKFFKELVIDFQSVIRFDYKLLTHFYFHLSLFLLIVCYSFIRFVGLSYHGSRLLSWLHRRLPRCDSPTRPRLSHHKFPRPLANADEIHTLWQRRHINLLGFGGDLA